jgi:DNA-binding MurR/RpiR family transcriptional regulator
MAKPPALAKSDATVADRIRAIADGMTPAEQKVARILFSSAMLAGLGTVASLAGRAKVSGPTVIRLTAKLGYASYPEFQAALHRELEARGTSPLSLHARSKPAKRGDVLAKSVEVFAAAMQRSFERASPAEFAAIVAALCDQRRTLFLAGGRFTQLIAEALYLHLFQMRAGVRLIRAGLQARNEQLLEIGRKSVLLICDFRRYQANSVSLARAAKQRGATVLLLTDPWESPIAEFADRVLIAEVTSPSPYDSMVPAFALAEALIGAALEALGKKAIARMKDLEGLRVGFEYQGDDRAGTKRGQERGRHG